MGEVNMLWLDSAYPLDKPTTAPGVRRGMCPGGESSTPTYVRKTYPDGYVKFANAAIGEINSTLIGSTLFPFPTTPPPPCVERCSEVPGQSTPECNGQARDRCLQMSRYENKCLWIECPSTSSSPAPSWVSASLSAHRARTAGRSNAHGIVAQDARNVQQRRQRLPLALLLQQRQLHCRRCASPGVRAMQNHG